MREKLTPPQWTDRLLEWFCDSLLWESIRGDLEELFVEDAELHGPRKARWLYVLHGIGFLRLTFMHKGKRLTTMTSFWQNYLRTILRSIRRQKALFIINLLGLTLAISCVLFAVVYIHDESQVDRYHTESEQLYRLYKRHIDIGEDVDHLTYETSGMMGPTMYDEYPEVIGYSRVLPWFGDVYLTHETQTVAEPNVHFADSSFLSFFQINMVRGAAESALAPPGSIVLSEDLASALFGEDNPMGKQVVAINDIKLTVTGVFERLPRQASLQPRVVISWSTTGPNGPLPMNFMNNWLAQGIYTFVQLQPGSDPTALEKALPNMMQQHFPERAENYFLKLMPFERMFLYGDDILSGRGMKVGSIRFLMTFGLSALLILLIASVNYVNLSLSRASQTKTEVGIRKVLGSDKGQLMARFVLETFLSLAIAAIVGWIIVYLTLPSINVLTGKDLPVEALWGPLPLLSLMGFVILLSLSLGLYPAHILSRPSVSVILQNTSGTSRGANLFTRALLTIQYGASIFLIITTMVIIRQTNYLENKPLGFDREQVLVVDLGQLGSDADVFENKLREHPNILEVSVCRSALGSGSYSTTTVPEGYTDELTTRVFGVDQEFFDTYGLDIVQGRAFRKGSRADSSRIIVNQALVDFMGWEDATDKTIRISGNDPLSIIGVVNDFHIHSLATSEVEPMIMYLSTQEYYNASVKLGSGDLRETIDYIDKSWRAVEERRPLTFHFVDEWFQALYENQRQLLQVTTIYSIISLLLCGMGLYGITSLILQRRLKEMSIRRVLGATLGNLLGLMNRQFLWIIIIGFAAATPLAYYAVTQWLEQFVYRIDTGLGPWIIALISVLTVSAAIISALSVRSATTNPSEHLRSE